MSEKLTDYLDLLYDFVYDSKKREKLMFKPISSEDVSDINNIKKPLDFDCTDIIKGNFKLINVESTRLTFKRTGDNSEKSCNITFGFYDDKNKNINDIGRSEIVHMRMQYLLSEIVANEGVPFITLPIMNFDIKFGKIKELNRELYDTILEYNKNKKDDDILFANVTEHYFKMYPFVEYIKNNEDIDINTIRIILFQIFYTLHSIAKRLPKFMHCKLSPNSLWVYEKKNVDGYNDYDVDGTNYKVPKINIEIKLTNFYDSVSGGYISNNDSRDNESSNPYFDIYCIVNTLKNELVRNNKFDNELQKFIDSILPKKYQVDNVDKIGSMEIENLSSSSIILKKNNFFSVFIRDNMDSDSQSEKKLNHTINRTIRNDVNYAHEKDNSDDNDIYDKANSFFIARNKLVNAPEDIDDKMVKRNTKHKDASEEEKDDDDDKDNENDEEDEEDKDEDEDNEDIEEDDEENDDDNIEEDEEEENDKNKKNKPKRNVEPERDGDVDKEVDNKRIDSKKETKKNNSNVISIDELKKEIREEIREEFKKELKEVRDELKRESQNVKHYKIEGSDEKKVHSNNNDKKYKIKRDSKQPDNNKKGKNKKHVSSSSDDKDVKHEKDNSSESSSSSDTKSSSSKISGGNKKIPNIHQSGNRFANLFNENLNNGMAFGNNNAANQFNNMLINSMREGPNEIPIEVSNEMQNKLMGNNGMAMQSMQPMQPMLPMQPMQPNGMLGMPQQPGIQQQMVMPQPNLGTDQPLSIPMSAVDNQGVNGIRIVGGQRDKFKKYKIVNNGGDDGNFFF